MGVQIDLGCREKNKVCIHISDQIDTTEVIR